VSGGSYGYLCFAVGDAAALAGKRGELGEMEQRLRHAGYRHAARQTRAVLDLLDAAEHAAGPLEGVWHAVEWRDSGDWGDAQMARVCGEFEAAREPKGALVP
jgi:hypothetical protein